jgi:hypothetical protein
MAMVEAGLEPENPEGSKPKQAKKAKKRKKQRQKRPRPVLPPELQRHRKISTREAAEIRGISVDTFRRHYGHLIEQVSPRRQAVTVGKLLDEPTSEPPPPSKKTPEVAS